MADYAFQTQFRQETVQGFEQRSTLLRAAVTTEAVIKGNTATFLVASSGGRSAITRGVNGRYPAGVNNLAQLSAVLVDWTDLALVTDFNVFASQGNQKLILQQEGIGVMNRKVDDDIIGCLDLATVDTGAATTADLGLVVKAKVILGNAQVPVNEVDNMFAVVSPAYMGYMLQIPEFASADYVNVKPLAGPMASYPRYLGLNWIEHPRLTGVGTAAEKCYIFHRASIGHAVNTGAMDVAIGYNEEQAYSFARVSAFMGSVVLQNNGIVQMIHDGSAYVGT